MKIQLQVVFRFEISCTCLCILNYFVLAPHLMISSGRILTDLSLDPSVSPNVDGLVNWTIGSAWGRGRIVNNMFVICGGGSLTNRYKVFFYALMDIVHKVL